MLFARNAQSLLMQLLKGYFKYSLYKSFSPEPLLPLLLYVLQRACLPVNLRNDFLSICLPLQLLFLPEKSVFALYLSCHLIFLSDAKVKVMF